MKAEKTTHRNEIRIRVDFSYHAETVTKLKQIDDARWSQSLKTWHIPYTKEAFAQLKTLFPELEYSAAPEHPLPNSTPPTPTLAITPSLPTIEGNDLTPSLTLKKAPEKDAIIIEITTKNIFVKLPKNEADIHFIRSFKYARWNSNQFCWAMPNFGKNAEKIQAYFQSRCPTVTDYSHRIEKPVERGVSFTRNEMVILNVSNRILKLYFSFNKELIADLKHIPLCRWNASENCWESPFSEKYLAELKELAHRYKLDVIFKEEQKSKLKARTSRYDK